MTDKVNGWSNQDTFVFNLWVNNDYGLYQQALQAKNSDDLYKLSHYAMTMGIITDDYDPDKVNYDEVFTALCES
jgi:hypothetical protein